MTTTRKIDTIDTKMTLRRNALKDFNGDKNKEGAADHKLDDD